MKLSFKNNILIAFVLISIGVGWLGIETYRNNLKYKDTVFWVEHTQEVLYATEQILSLNQDVETAVRGYLITNNEAFLRPFSDAEKTSARLFRYLKELIKQDSLQQKRLDQLFNLTLKKINYTSSSLEIYKKEGFDAAKKVISGGQGLAYMDTIRTLVAQVQAEEKRLLKVRKDANDKSNKAYNLSFFLQLIGIVIAILLSSLVIFYNLSAKIKVQQLLAENQHLLQSIIDNTSSLISIKDPEGRFILLNKKYKELLGLGIDEIKGKTAFDFFPEETATNIRAAELKAIKEKMLVETEEDARFDGEMQHFFSLTFPIYKSNGSFYAICGISTNITEIKKQANLIQNLYDYAPSGYYSISAEGKFVNANETTLNWLGYTKDELIGMNFKNILTKECVEDFQKTFPVFKQTGRLHDKEFTYIRKDKTLLPVLLNATAEKDEAGNFKYSRSSIVDITERKKLEEDLKQVNEELESFTYSISHDLRAPLRIINGYAGIISEEYTKSLDDDGHRMVKNIIENVNRMGQLIDDLLNFSRLGRKELVMHAINMTALVNQILEEELRNSDTTKYKVVVSDLGTSYCDSSLIKQVWQNLISNAIKYASKATLPVIEISCIQTPEENIFCIKDNGIGFNMAYYDKLFGVFQRLHKASEYPGTGVGLALAQRIISKHRGRIWAESIVDEGAVFYFSLKSGKT